MKIILAPVLMGYVTGWQEPGGADEKGEALSHNLHHVLYILGDVRSEVDVGVLVSACATNFQENPFSPTALQWLRCMFCFDAETATSNLEEVIASLGESERKQRMVAWFANIFNGHQGVSIKLKDEANRGSVLSRLVRIAYRYILPSEDRRHEGSYSPDTRDDAQYARSSLLNQLIDLPVPGVQDVLNELAADPALESVSEYLLKRVQVRVAKDADPTPWTVEEILAFEIKFERIPHDRDTLFQVMLNRLDDLQRDVSHHDFFPRKTIREIVKEDEMQRFIALLLAKESKGSYSVVREDEAADGKRTDIRLLANGVEHRAVIEIKLADKRWTLKELEKALEDQLNQQYLRHENCKAGCLLITNHAGHENRKSKKRNLKRTYWQHPVTGKRLEWEGVIDHLQEKAKVLQSNDDFGVRLAVVGLDLSDPKLKPAHKQRL